MQMTLLGPEDRPRNLYQIVNIQSWPYSDTYLDLTMLDTSGMVVGTGVGFGSRQVKVKCASWGIVLEVRVHASHLASIRTHTTRRLPGLDVAPYHGSHVTLVVHESSIKVWSVIRVCGLDVGESTREWIFLYSLVSDGRQ